MAKLFKIEHSQQWGKKKARPTSFAITIFWVTKLIQEWWNASKISWGPYALYIEVQASFNMLKHLAMEVIIMSMPLHCVSFSCLFGRTCVSCNGHKNHVLPHLEFVTTTFNSFDLWMSKGDIDTFASVVNYFNEACIPRHATMGLFEMHEINGIAMAL